MKYLKFGLAFVFILILSGCLFKRDSMEDINIYTTIYPVNYLIDYLYGNNANIYSIYPSDVDVLEYELSNKKIDEYAHSDLFVFNSLDKDRDYAVKMLNKNKNLKVIDVSMGMSYNNSIEELWLNPYNYLMMAQNVKDGLLEYVTNPYLISNNDKTGIEDRYESLKYELSNLDANLKEAINGASYTTIVVDNDLFKFLEKYNLKVISLEENENLTEPVLNEVKKLINDGDIKYIYSINTTSNKTVEKFLEDSQVQLLTLNAMKTIDGGITNSNESYLTIMNQNIELLNKELYK